jgi:hypothetical protein
MARASPPLNGRGRRGARSVAFVMMEIRYSVRFCDVKREAQALAYCVR